MIEVKKIPFMEWITEPPNVFCLQNVFCTVEQNNERYTVFAHVGRERDMTAKNVIAYMIIPHIQTDRSPWKSEYSGDELPEKSGQYICCMECAAGHSERLKIRQMWFDKRTQKFSGVEALGYMHIPKPYSGKKTLSFLKES